MLCGRFADMLPPIPFLPLVSQFARRSFFRNVAKLFYRFYNGLHLTHVNPFFILGRIHAAVNGDAFSIDVDEGKLAVIVQKNLKWLQI